MPRWLRRAAIVVVALLVVGAVVVVVTARPQLQDDRDAVDNSWLPLRADLVTRYAALGTVLAELQNAGDGDRDVAADLERQLERWNDLADSDDVDAETEVEAANALEGSAARVQAAVTNSPRLSGVQPLLDALAVFAGTLPPTDAVAAYNDAAEEYQRTREGLRRSLAASLFGFDARPTLVVPEPAAPEPG